MKRKLKVRVISKYPWGIPNDWYGTTVLVREVTRKEEYIDMLGNRKSETYFRLVDSIYTYIKKEDCKVVSFTNKIGGIANEQRLERGTDRA